MTEQFWQRLGGLWPGGGSEQWAETGIALLLLLLAFVANWITKQLVLRLLPRLLGRLSLEDEQPHVLAFVARLSNIVPALVIQAGVGAVPHLPQGSGQLVSRLAMAFIALTIAMALSRVLTIANNLYERRPEAASRPVKGYVQLLKLLLYGAATIFVIAGLLGQSPLLLLSGFGAMAAVLMLVFKDTLLSLVASVQIGSNDMVRVGDWIEMPQLNVDGNVTDIALHTVTVQNWDKTLSTIPTYRLITDSFRNWRNVSRRGIWRILRSLMLDQSSVRFLDAELQQRLSRFALLRDYLAQKQQEVGKWNETRAAGQVADRRRLTNIGTFRAYLLAYLATVPKVVTSGETFVVRQLEPTENGLPLQIYAFVEGASWAEYERIQSDIFDHLIAILPEFGLRPFQNPGGFDLARMEERLRQGAGRAGRPRGDEVAGADARF